MSCCSCLNPVNWGDRDGVTVLMGAAMGGNVEEVRRLLEERGASIDQGCSHFLTALYWAAGVGGDEHVDTVKLLLDKGAIIEGHGWAISTPLQNACGKGNANSIYLIHYYEYRTYEY